MIFPKNWKKIGKNGSFPGLVGAVPWSAMPCASRTPLRRRQVRPDVYWTCSPHMPSCDRTFGLCIVLRSKSDKGIAVLDHEHRLKGLVTWQNLGTSSTSKDSSAGISCLEHPARLRLALLLHPSRMSRGAGVENCRLVLPVLPPAGRIAVTRGKNLRPVHRSHVSHMPSRA